MPRYQVEFEGKKYEIEGPNEPTEEDVRAALAQSTPQPTGDMFETKLETEGIQRENQNMTQFLQQEQAKKEAADPRNWTFEQTKENKKKNPPKNQQEEAMQAALLDEKKQEKDKIVNARKDMEKFKEDGVKARRKQNDDFFKEGIKLFKEGTEKVREAVTLGPIGKGISGDVLARLPQAALVMGKMMVDEARQPKTARLYRWAGQPEAAAALEGIFKESTPLFTKFNKKAEELRVKNVEWVEKNYPRDEVGIAKFFRDLGGAGGSLALSIGATLLTKSLDAGAVLFGVIQGSDVYQEAIDAGKSHEEAFAIATPAAVAEAALEKIGLKFLLDGYQGKFAAGMMKAVQKGVKNTKLGSFLFKGATEFVQEAAQTGAESAITQAESFGTQAFNKVTGSNVEDESIRKYQGLMPILQDMAYAGALGFITGGGASVMLDIRQNTIQELQEKADMSQQEAEDVADRILKGSAEAGENIINEALDDMDSQELKPDLIEEVDKDNIPQELQDNVKDIIKQAGGRPIDFNAGISKTSEINDKGPSVQFNPPTGTDTTISLPLKNLTVEKVENKIEATMARLEKAKAESDTVQRPLDELKKDVLSQVKKKTVRPLIEEAKKYKTVDEFVDAKLDSVAQMQRATPEASRLPAFDISQTWGDLLEVSGDLINRLFESPRFFKGQAAHEKIRMLQRRLDSGYLQEVINSVPKEKQAEMDAILKNYAKEYKNIPAYNELQEKAKQIPILIANKEFSKAKALVDEMAELSKDKEAWKASILESSQLTDIYNKAHAKDGGKVPPKPPKKTAQAPQEPEPGKEFNVFEPQPLKPGQVKHQVRDVSGQIKDKVTLTEQAALKRDYQMQRKGAFASKKETTAIIKKIRQIKKMPIQGMHFEEKKAINQIKQEYAKVKDLAGLRAVYTKVQALKEQGKFKYLLNKVARDQKHKLEKDILIKTLDTAKVEGKVINQESREKNNATAVAYKVFRAKTLRPSRIFDYMDGGQDFKGAHNKFFYDRENRAVEAEIKEVKSREKEMEKMLAGVNKTRVDFEQKREVNGKNFSGQEFVTAYVAKQAQLAGDPTKMLALVYGNKWSAETVEKMAAEITKEEKAIADFILQDYANSYARVRNAYIDFTDGKEDLGERPFYTPIRRTETGYDPVDAELAKELLERASLKKAYADRGFSRERINVPAEFQKPIRTDEMSVWYEQVRKQEHFITHGNMVKEMQRMVSDPDYREAIVDNPKLGEPYYDTIKNYVNRIANPNIYRTYSTLEKYSKMLRKNAAIANLAFNLITIGKQAPSMALFMGDVGPVGLLEGVQELMSDYESKVKFIAEKSPQMSERSIERTMEEFKQYSPEAYQRVINKVGQVGMRGIVLMDQFVTHAGWLAYYNHGLNSDMSEQEAAENATKQVLRTQPAAHAKDIAEIYATSEFLNHWLMFSNQLSNIYNIVTYDIPAAFKQGKTEKGITQAVGVMLAGMMIWSLMKGRLPQDEEDVKDMVANQTLSIIPVVGSQLNAMRQGFEGGVPTGESIKALWNFGVGVANEDTRKTVENLAKVGAYGFGVPFAQPRRTIKGVERLAKGETQDTREILWSEWALKKKPASLAQFNRAYKKAKKDKTSYEYLMLKSYYSKLLKINKKLKLATDKATKDLLRDQIKSIAKEALEIIK